MYALSALDYRVSGGGMGPQGTIPHTNISAAPVGPTPSQGGFVSVPTATLPVARSGAVRGRLDGVMVSKPVVSPVGPPRGTMGGYPVSVSPGPIGIRPVGGPVFRNPSVPFNSTRYPGQMGWSNEITPVY